MGLKEILILSGIILLIIGLIILAFIIRGILLIKKGKYTKAKLAQTLGRYAAIRQYRLLKDVSIPTGSGNALCDFVLVGIFGVTIINCLEAKGEVYCNPKFDNWAVANKNKSYKVENPVKRLESGVFALRDLFAKKKIYKMQIDSIVVYSPKSIPCDIGSLPVVSVKKLKAILAKEKYHTDNGVDMERIAKALTGENN